MMNNRHVPTSLLIVRVGAGFVATPPLVSLREGEHTHLRGMAALQPDFGGSCRRMNAGGVATIVPAARRRVSEPTATVSLEILMCCMS
jgi:hypothetical protein